MHVSVWLHSRTWPRSRLLCLYQASEVDYNQELGEYGRFQFSLPSNAAVEQTLLDGGLIAFVSDAGVAPFVGRVESLTEEEAGNKVTVVGREWISVMDDRWTDQSGISDGLVGDSALQVGRLANARNDTGIHFADPLSLSLMPEKQATKGNSVLDTWKNLATMSGDEWLTYYRVGRSVQGVFFWMSKVGKDLRNLIHVFDVAMASRRYELDRLNEAQAIRVVASTGDYKSRPSASYVTNTSMLPASTVVYTGRTIPHFHSQIGVREITADEQLLPGQRSATSQAKAAFSALGLNAETLVISVTGAVDWTPLAVGNVITAHISKIRFGLGFVTPFRILGVQPDHSQGVLHLVGKVVT